MRVAVDDAEMGERQPPGAEHRLASRLRSLSGSLTWASIFSPSSQSSVSRRPVDSSGQTSERECRPGPEHGGRARRASPRGYSRAPRAGARRSRPRSRWCRSPGPCACAAPKQLQLGEVGFDRRLHVGILQLAGELAAVERARPVHLAERGGGGRMMLEGGEFFLPAGPSSASMRRLTKAEPIGGASLCSLVSSSAYSGGSASGMVASSCATFISGPLRPPSAAASAIALPPRSSLSPSARDVAMRAATPPTWVPTWA